MHKFILMTAIVLASTAAQAGTRGLIAVASTETADPVKPAEQTAPAVQAPVVSARCAQPAAPKSTETRPADALAKRADARPVRKVSHDGDRAWAEHRIRSELARYGIY